LIQDISFAHAMHLSLSDHVHHFKAPARVRHAVSNEKKPCAGYLDYPFQNKLFGCGSLAHFSYPKRLIFSKTLVF